MALDEVVDQRARDAEARRNRRQRVGCEPGSVRDLRRIRDDLTTGPLRGEAAPSKIR